MLFPVVLALLAVAPHGREGDAQAFTALTDAQGKAIADARYAQWVTGDVLHVESRADFPDGRSILEQTELRMHPQLEQLTWTWTERNGDRLLREYTIDFRTRTAVATRVDQGKRWKEDID